MTYFISGIGTNVGKTLVSAVLTEALNADYWKPVQSGISEGLDSETVRSLAGNSKTHIHPESYLLNAPLSPHFAAKLDGVVIELAEIRKPETNNLLIVEGAGGLLVPLNNEHYVIELAQQLDCGVVLVVSSYLGCINHTLLSLAYLQSNAYRISALVFNGMFEPEVKEAILRKAAGIPVIDIPPLEHISARAVAELAEQKRPEIEQIFVGK